MQILTMGYLNKTIYFVFTVPSIQLCYYNIVIENVLTGIKCSKLSIFVDIFTFTSIIALYKLDMK